MLHLELGLHADTDTEARKLLPEGRVLDVRVAVAFVEPARRQEGIAPDGGGGGVEERDLARLSDVRPAHPQVLVLAHEVAVPHRGRLDADEAVHVALPVAVRETRERVRADHDVGVDEEQERAARGTRAHVARGCRADAPRRRHDADREIRRDRRRLVGRPVVHEHHLEVDVGGLEEPGQTLRQRRGRVVDRDHHGHRGRRHGRRPPPREPARHRGHAAPAVLGVAAWIGPIRTHGQFFPAAASSIPLIALSSLFASASARAGSRAARSLVSSGSRSRSNNRRSPRDVVISL